MVFYSARQADEPSWWDSALASGMVNKPHQDVSTGQRYLLSLYFITATMMAVGYGDLHPVTTPERAFAILVQVIGASFIGVMLATVGQLLDSLNARNQAQTSKMQEVREYMKDRKLPKELCARIQDYYTNYFECVRVATECCDCVVVVLRSLFSLNAPSPPPSPPFLDQAQNHLQRARHFPWPVPAHPQRHHPALQPQAH